MAKDTSNGIRDFVKNALKTYYDNFQVKLADNASKDDVNPAIKLNNDGSVYIYDIGGYNGTNIQDASSLQSIIKDNTVTITPGVNISTQKGNQSLTISALGYTYNQEKNSFAELNSNTASGNNAHAEGNKTKASGEGSHAEGWNTHATSYQAHAEGSATQANGWHSHAEGYMTTASSADAHAEGNNTTASGAASHSEGNQTKASGNYSHTEGNYTEAKNEGEHASGMYNKSNNQDANAQTIFSIGIGTSDTDRKNAIEVLRDGRVFIKGIGGYDGTNPFGSISLQDFLSSLSTTSTMSNTGFLGNFEDI